MDGNSVLVMLGILPIAIAASVAVLWIVGSFPGPRARSAYGSDPDLIPSNVFLFENGYLSDHDCPPSADLVAIDSWADLKKWLGDRFPTLPDNLSDQSTSAAVYSTKDQPEDEANLIVELNGDTVRVTLSDPASAHPAERHRALRSLKTLEADHAALNMAPCAMWKTNASGHIVWRNDACTRVLDDKLDDLMENVEIPVGEDQRTSSRVAVAGPTGKRETWFDIDAINARSFTIFYATDITNAVQAEAAQREFVQTLTKTFANLTTGLAIFDRNKYLALFNPALVDLTALPADFLSGTPSLMGFFDKLRDRQVMPEPKNYADWRSQINAMIEEASGGLYQETWSLPSGVTFRVTGRPHPDGAVAFLFEDISAEISLTRRFRAQNDLRQSVLDNIGHAIAVIAPNNVVIFCNATWTELFGVDPDTCFAELSVRDLAAICRQKYPHEDFWQSVETHITCQTLSHAIEETIRIETPDGARTLQCRLVPVSGGAALMCHPVNESVLMPEGPRAINS